ncbi:MAG: ABC transporter permease [Eubacteriales bacterium]|nr:ABC transporter permease [Eubacteriales bacterium]
MEKLKRLINKIDKVYLLSLIISIFVALVIGGVLIAATGNNPFVGYGAMLNGVFGSSRVLGNTIAKALTLCLTGLAMSVAARAGMFNVGGEGQLFLGGLGATLAGIACHGLSPWIAIPCALIAAMAVGGAAAWFPAWLKVKLKVSEVITTIMFNSATIFFCTYLVNGPLKTTDKGVLAGTDSIDVAHRFATIIPRSNLTTALFYSVVIAFFVWYLMSKTSVGLEMKVTGENQRFALFSGLKKDKIMIWSMVASGAICGLVGMFEVYGIQWRFTETISNEFYFDGMLVAMIMNYNPIGIIIMSFFFGALKIGAAAMELSTGISGEISDIVFAIIIFLMAAQSGITKQIQLKLAKRKAKKTTGKEKNHGSAYTNI